MDHEAIDPHERETHMTAIVILNAVLAVFIVTSVLSLLGWGIVSDRAWPATRPFGGRGARRRHRSARSGALRLAFGRIPSERGRR
jgi:hypothetical protein